MYHSTNGAFAEACHIYINCGVSYLYNIIKQSDIRHSSAIIIYDIGIGSALNCITTLIWQQSLARIGMTAPQIHYVGIEKYPISVDEAMQLNFPAHITEMQHLLYQTGNNIFIKEEIDRWFKLLHTSAWGQDIVIVPGFTLTKIKGDITECKADNFKSRIYPKAPAVIYYDTFSPSTQPKLWEKHIFEEIFNGVNYQSVLTTYCSKGTVKQAIREAGFKLERLPGPVGKRHIIRGIKLNS